MNILHPFNSIGRLGKALGVLAIIFVAVPLQLFAQFTPLVRIETSGQANSQVPGFYVAMFKLVPTRATTTLGSGTLTIFTVNDRTNPVSETPVNFPTSTTVITQDVDGMSPGTYIAELYADSQLISQSARFTISAGSESSDGLSIVYPPRDQVINKTSATIKGFVVTQVAMPIQLSFVSGPVGSPLGNEQPLLSVANADAGVEIPITMTFTGLSEGHSYQFAVKNLFLNKTSAPLQFSTPTGNERVGLTYGGAIAPYIPRIGGDDVPPDITVEDDISDKGIVPKCGRTQNAAKSIPDKELAPCGYDNFLELISNILKYAIIILGPIIACIVLYSGAMIMWLGKDKDPTSDVMKEIKAHGARLVRVAIGIAIILLAWLIIATILRELGVKEAYSFLDIFG